MSSKAGILIFLALCGLFLNALLLYWKLSDSSGGIIGCGGSNACNEVLASRWSQVFGLPLAGLGILIYGLLYAALLWRKSNLAAFCFSAVFVTAIWMVIVQAILLKHFCPWCMATHGVACLITVIGLCVNRWDEGFRIGLQAGAAAAIALALAQLYGPVPATHRVEEGTNLVESQITRFHAQGTGRKVSFGDGRLTFDVSALPHLGSSDADHVMVEYFDYQCPSCHILRGYLSALVRKHQEKICILLLPVPLDRGCNPSLPLEVAGHPGSCSLTRIALAVWRAKPEAYLAIHDVFMTAPPADAAAALEIARQHVPAAQLDAALLDPWIEQLIQADIADWVSFSEKTKVLPKLLISGKRILHGLPSGEEDFIRVMEQELGL